MIVVATTAIIKIATEGVVEVVEAYSGRPSVKLRGPLGSFSPGIGPPNHTFFILFFIFIFKCEFGAPPKK